MRRYETVFIVNADISEEERNTLLGKVKDLIGQKGGELLLFDEWGAQKLAYEIRKKTRGYYVRMDYCGEGSAVAELERSFRIDDRILKFLTVLLEKQADVEKIKESLAKSEAAQVPAETAGAAAAQIPVAAAAESVQPVTETAEPANSPEKEEEAAIEAVKDDKNADEKREEE